MPDYDWENASTFEQSKGNGAGWAVLLALLATLLLHLGLILWGIQKFVGVEIPPQPEEETIELRLTDTSTTFDEATEPAPIEEVEKPDVEGEAVTSFEEATPSEDSFDLALAPADEVALPDEVELARPPALGLETGTLPEPTIGEVSDAVEPIAGQIADLFPEAKAGQIVVDPGKPVADVHDSEAINEALGRMQGQGGTSVQVSELQGYTGLAEYARMTPGQLSANKATVASDLLFEFNSATLREDARPALLTLAMLIERQPTMHCWVEGHTDLIGSEAYNRELSARRAGAVKTWLVRSLGLPANRIHVRARGKSSPVVLEGSAEDQAPNRRVDLAMRAEPPPAPARAEPVVIEEKPPAPPAPPAQIVEPTPLPEPPTPPRAEVVQPEPAPLEPTPPRAEVVEDTPPPTPIIPKAEPVELPE